MHVGAPPRRRSRHRSVHALRGERCGSSSPRRIAQTTRRLLRGRSEPQPYAAGEGRIRRRSDQRRVGQASAARHARAISFSIAMVFARRMFLADIQDFNYAGLRSDTDEIISCQMYLPMPGHSATTADFFNPLMRHIETLVLENRAPYPVERTLLTSGMTLAAVDSIHNGYTPINTREMAVTYTAPTESRFWRD